MTNKKGLFGAILGSFVGSIPFVLLLSFYSIPSFILAIASPIGAFSFYKAFDGEKSFEKAKSYVTLSSLGFLLLFSALGLIYSYAKGVEIFSSALFILNPLSACLFGSHLINKNAEKYASTKSKEEIYNASYRSSIKLNFEDFRFFYPKKNNFIFIAMAIFAVGILIFILAIGKIANLKNGYFMQISLALWAILFLYCVYFEFKKLNLIIIAYKKRYFILDIARLNMIKDYCFRKSKLNFLISYDNLPEENKELLTATAVLAVRDLITQKGKNETMLNYAVKELLGFELIKSTSLGYKFSFKQKNGTLSSKSVSKGYLGLEIFESKADGGKK